MFLLRILATFFLFLRFGEARPTFLRRSPLLETSDVYECSTVLPQLTLDDWEYLREIQDAFQNYGISSEERVELLKEVMSLHHPDTPEEEINANAHYLFVLYTYTDFDRTVISKRKDLADLASHEIVFSALGTKNITLKIAQLSRIAEAVEKSHGKDAKKLMQKTLQVIIQLDEFFEKTSQKWKLDLFKNTINCFLNNSKEK